MTAEKILPFTDIDNVQAFLLDVAGVFFGGDKTGLYQGTLETFEALRKEEKRIGLITNTTSLSSIMEERLDKFGLHKEEHYDFLFTAGQVFKDALLFDQLPFKIEKKKYWMFGGRHPIYGRHRDALFANTKYTETKNLEEADFIFIEVPHIRGKDTSETQEFETAIKQLITRMDQLGMKPPYLPMVCSNPDRFVKEGNPPQLLAKQGIIAELYENEGGKAFRYGKPGGFIFRKAFQKFGEYGIKDKKKVVMVGDSPSTDIRGAKQEQFPSILVTDTGIAYEEKAGKEVSQYLKNLPLSDKPTYWIPRFTHLREMI